MRCVQVQLGPRAYLVYISAKVCCDAPFAAYWVLLEQLLCNGQQYLIYSTGSVVLLPNPVTALRNWDAAADTASSFNQSINQQCICVARRH